MPITPARAADFARALTLVRPITRRRLYWTARGVFVTDRTQVKAFDAVFFSVFGQRDRDEPFDPENPEIVPAPPDDRPAAPHDSSPRGSEEAERQAESSSSAPAEGDDDEDASEVEVPLAMASDEEVLGQKSFDALAPHELAQLYRLMTQLELATPLRRTRRHERGRHGRASTCAAACAPACAPAATRSALPVAAGASSRGAW